MRFQQKKLSYWLSSSIARPKPPMNEWLVSETKAKIKAESRAKTCKPAPTCTTIDTQTFGKVNFSFLSSLSRQAKLSHWNSLIDDDIIMKKLLYKFRERERETVSLCQCRCLCRLRDFQFFGAAKSRHTQGGLEWQTACMWTWANRPSRTELMSLDMYYTHTFSALPYHCTALLTLNLVIYFAFKFKFTSPLSLCTLALL